MAFQYGEDQVAYAKAETTFGTAVKPTATDALLVTQMNVTPIRDRPIVSDRENTRSVQERIDGRSSASFSMSGTVRPSGVAGTAPDIGGLLKHAFGTETVAAWMSVTYTLLKDPSALSLSIYRKLADVLDGVYGAVITGLTLNWSGDDFATWSIEGIGKEFLSAGKDAADGAGSSSSSLTVDDGDFYDKYGIIKIGSEDNSGAGIQITAVSGNVLTLESTFSWSDNDVTEAFVPTGTFTGSPVYGTTGSLSWDGGSSTVQHIGGSVSLQTGIGLHEREYGTSTPNSVTLPSDRQVTCNMSMLLEDTEWDKQGEFRKRTAQDIHAVIGTTAGSILTIDMPRAEIDPAGVDASTGMVEVSVSGQALTSTTSATEDELQLIFT